MKNNTNNNTKTAIFLMGPTACGKTSLAISIAKNFPVEIINVDSAQVYIGMDIGTNKPSKEELIITKHHLIDICSPKNNYSVAQFCSDASSLLEEIHCRGNIPLLVGGTMLYFYALCFGLSKLPSSNLEIRNDINMQAKEHGWPYMHAKLAELDQKTADKLSINDSQRIQRALEVYASTGRKFSDYLMEVERHNFIDDWNIKYFSIVQKDREILHKKIADRFYIMLEKGLVNEVNGLLQQSIPTNMPAMRSVGYRQIIEYLQNKITEQDAYQKAIIATRQLAKRQYTWLRKWQSLVNLNILYTELSEQYNLRLITRNIKC